MSYVNTVLADDPMTFWLLAEASGAAAVDQATLGHATGFINTGTYVGGPTLGVSPPVAVNRAVETTSSSYISLPRRTGGWGVDWGIEFWFSYVSGNVLFSSSAGIWRIDISATRPVVVLGNPPYGTQSHTVTTVTSASLKTGGHQIAFSSDGLTMRFYVDGVLKDSWAAGIYADPEYMGDYLLFGRNGPNGAYQPNVYAAVSTYSPRPTDSEIADHYAARNDQGLNPVVISTAPAVVDPYHPGTAEITVTAQPLTPAYLVTTKSVLVLDSSTTSEVVNPLVAPGLTVEPLHVVAQATPVATLVDGRPT